MHLWKYLANNNVLYAFVQNLLAARLKSLAYMSKSIRTIF